MLGRGDKQPGRHRKRAVGLILQTLGRPRSIGTRAAGPGRALEHKTHPQGVPETLVTS